MSADFCFYNTITILEDIMSQKKRKKRKKRCPNGAIIQLENGKYFGRAPLGYTGKRYVYQRVTGNTKAEVRSQIAQIKLRYSGTEVTEESLMSLSTWMDYWLEEIKKPMLGSTTYDNYRSFIDKHINPLIGFKKLIHITREDIVRFIERLQNGYVANKRKKTIKHLAYSSIHEIYCVLAAALKSASGSGFIPENPCNSIKIPKRVKTDVPILLSEEIICFLKVLESDPFWYPFFYMELMTGLRRGELCGLKWEDFNADNGELHIHRSIKYYYNELTQTSTKTNAGRRVIILSSSVIDVLLERKKHTSSEWMFCAENDDTLPVNPAIITPKLKAVFVEAKLPYIRFHNLRHTFATQAISNGVEPETLSVLMGHADPVFTLNTYTHNTTDIESNAVKYMDIILDHLLEG